MLTVIVHPKEQGHDCRTLSFSGEIIVLGRGDDCDVHIDDESVSRHHAVLRFRDGGYSIADQGSANGTHFGARPLEPHTRHAVTDGDFFRIGDVLIETRLSLSPPSFATACSTREMAMGLANHLCSVRQLQPGPRIIGIEGADKGQILELPDAAPRVLGRSRSADLPLADHETSRRHVEVRLVRDRLIVRDLGSENGAELEGKRLAPNQDLEWQPGATLRLGSSVFIFQYEREPADRAPRDSREDTALQPAPKSDVQVNANRTSVHDSSTAGPMEGNRPTAAKRRVDWGIGTLVLLAVVGGGALVCISLIVLLFS